MFTELVRIGYSFLACCGGLAKFQRCILTLALPSCSGSLWLVGHTSHLVLYCNRLVLNTRRQHKLIIVESKQTCPKHNRYFLS